MGKHMYQVGGKDHWEKSLSLLLVNGKQYGMKDVEYPEEFYKQKLTTAQECAEKIQGRVDIWINE